VLVVVLLLQACSTLKLAYHQAPHLAYWYLDGYVDFTHAQRPQVAAALQDLHRWHRQTQLPATLDTLQQLRALVPADLDAQQACTVYAELRGQLLAIPARAAPAVAALVVDLNAGQLAHLERRLTRKNAEFRHEFLDAPIPKVRAERSQKAIERAEMLYGRLDAAQRELIQQRLDASRFDARQAYAERLRRQQDLLHTLRPLIDHQASPAAAQAAVLALWERTLAPPDAAQRTYAHTLEQEACANFADLHNSTTPAQRHRAAETLGRHVQGLRTLVSVGL
jgi:hypothetical protein